MIEALTSVLQPYRLPWNRATLWADGFAWGVFVTCITELLIFGDSFMGGVPALTLLSAGLAFFALTKFVVLVLQVFPRFRRTTTDKYEARTRAMGGLSAGFAGLLVGVIRHVVPLWEGPRSAVILAASLAAIFVYLKVGYKIVDHLINKNAFPDAA